MDVDVRRVTRVVVGLCLVSLFVSAAVLFVAGFHDNAQMNELRTDGVPVEITVAKCLGLLGGSGSNQAGQRGYRLPITPVNCPKKNKATNNGAFSLGMGRAVSAK